MKPHILLTSFDIWEPHHISNASDDLLDAMIKQNLFVLLDAEITLLRKLPVDFQLAPQHVIFRLEALQPNIVICCGMAEQRSQLTLESNGKYQTTMLKTTVDLDRLVNDLEMTAISHDAGAFVCNHLYYSVLQYIDDRRLECQCLFIHVPLFNESNCRLIVKDFLTILRSLLSPSLPLLKQKSAQ
ncbi:MAG: peptidase C15 [Leptolyngbya sp. BL-A-14]